MGERPLTRWRRDQDDTSRASSRIDRPSSAGPRPQSKVERPTSRRGLKEDSFDYGTHGSYRAATPSQSALARSPSASVFLNRVSTASSRLTTMGSSTGLGRINTGLSSNQMNVNLLNRPITQQGIAGVRPGTTRGLPMTRHIQDKRYYEGLLQLKIRELTQEIASIKRDIDNQNKERATFLHLDKRAKEMAAELTALQAELADYNIVVDKMTSNTEKAVVEQEAEELAQKNERALMEIERVFEQRRQLEQELRKTEKELEEERKSTEKLVENMDSNTRVKYNDLYQQKTQLQETVNKMQEELDALNREQSRLEEHIALSPLKQEAVKLHIKIMEAESKRDKLKEEERNRLSPETERERLLQKIKQDNADIAAAEAQLADKKKQVSQAEQELEQLETELEDNQSEKQNKYKELRKREEVMEQFMFTFKDNKQEEIEKLENLEKSIVERLISISNKIDISVDLTTGDEIALLSGEFLHNYEHTNRDRSFEGLKNEHTRLQQTLRKMEMLEQKLRSESQELNDKINKQQSELITLEDLDGLKTRSELKKEELSSEREKLVNEQLICSQELKVVQEKYKDLKEKLDRNEAYRDIDTLEIKLEKLKENNRNLKEHIMAQKDRINYIPLREEAFLLAEKYNTVLADNLKSIY